MKHVHIYHIYYPVRQSLEVKISGPPGAGKTRTLRDECVALLKIQHKVFCVAAANVAVDTDATTVWQALTPEERQKYKCLRLEARAAQIAAILVKVNYAAYKGEHGTEDNLPEYADNETAQDSPNMRNALEKLAADFAIRQNQMKDLMAEYDNVEKVYQLLRGDPRRKRSNVATGMTLDYRIWELTEADKAEAEVRYAAARAAMGEEEFTRQHAASLIYLEMFDRSAKYRECVANYILTTACSRGRSDWLFRMQATRSSPGYQLRSYEERVVKEE